MSNNLADMNESEAQEYVKSVVGDIIGAAFGIRSSLMESIKRSETLNFQMPTIDQILLAMIIFELRNPAD